MTPAAIDRIDEIRRKTQPAPRMRLTDFARGSAWREKLPECGMIEVTDRSETAGWLLSNEYMEDMLQLVDDLAVELEREQVAAMVDARRGCQDWLSGNALAQRALASFQDRKEAMRAVLDGD